MDAPSTKPAPYGLPGSVTSPHSPSRTLAGGPFQLAPRELLGLETTSPQRAGFSPADDTCTPPPFQTRVPRAGSYLGF